MGQVMPGRDAHRWRLAEARNLFFGRGDLPNGLLDTTILDSWRRCRTAGLDVAVGGECGIVGPAALKGEQERNRTLVLSAQAIIDNLFDQIRHSGSMVILTDANGLVLQSLGDAEFVDRASRVTLQPGACWEESERGTNAIGTALVEAVPIEVFGAEHFLERNGFLSCSAAPVRDGCGQLIGVLDISGDYRAYQRHTLGLVRMSAQIIEQRLFEIGAGRNVIVSFHPRCEYLGCLGEGRLAVSPDGKIVLVNHAGVQLLGLRRSEIVNRDFGAVFEPSFGQVIDRARLDGESPACVATADGRQLFLRLRGDLPRGQRFGLAIGDGAARPAQTATVARGCPAAGLTLDMVGNGDERLQVAVDKARRVLGRDIPILIQGESGAGKEMFAKAFHNSGPRRDGSFVALNCAAIPENLIESELFGYQGGAFTGARKEGSVGKVQQAHGGTLFLDEIGDMPLQLQARLLRVLQERCVTPLGGSKAIQVDISLICATHRRLKDEVLRGRFREDLYYRLNGLCLTLPALRDRTDLRQLVAKLLRAETGGGRDIRVDDSVMRVFERYPWPGNIRQLNNVLRVAIALLDDDDNIITEYHLPEEMFEVMDEDPAAAGLAADPLPCAAGGADAGMANTLGDVEQRAIRAMLVEVGGNISAAARRLGISRNTLYRKIGRL